MTLYRHEMKMNFKSLLIWTLCVGGMCFGCILLYYSVKDTMAGMAETFENMGGMSAALGMDKMSLATVTGYYATEIALMHGLGGSMFAAILGSGLLSKEESFHTSEFLHAFPVGRTSILFQKYLALVSNIVIFNLVCVALYLLGFLIIGEDVPGKEMFLFHLAQILMQIEIGTLCFLLSSVSKKVQLGAGLGIAILFFAADMMCRIIPAIENVKYITPFYYASASDIFSSHTLDGTLTGIGIGITILALLSSYCIYRRKDLAA